VRIRSIELSNYRQFAGYSKLHFGAGGLEKFSIIYGTNGGGKTTLLSAVFWAFHGETRFINQPNQLATASVLAKSSEPLQVSVAVEFDDGGSTFRIQRTQQFTQEAGIQKPVGPSKVTLLDDARNEINPPQREINKRLPLTLSRFFFFPGEHLEGFFAPERLQSLVADVKAISMVGLFEEALHLTTLANGRLLADLRQLTDNQKIRAYTDQISGIRRQILEFETQLIPIQSRVEELRILISEMDKDTPTNHADSDLASELDLANSSIADAYLEIGKATQEINSLLQGKGYLAFLERVPKALENCDRHDHPKVDVWRHLKPEQFESLKSDGKCFCGCDLNASKLEILASRLSPEAPHQNSVADVVGELENLFQGDFSLDDFRNKVRLALERKVLADQNRKALEQKRLDLASQLGDESLSKITRLSELQGEFREKAAKLVEITESLEESSSELARVERKLANEQDKSSGVELIKSQRLLASRIEEALTAELEGNRTSFMSELRMEVSGILKNLIVQAVDVEVLDDLTIEVFEPGTQAPFGLAGGQEKAKPIAMAIALQRIARRRASKARELNASLTDEYPLMIDSAFGELGTDLRRKVVAELIKESGQTILLVSDTQAFGVADSIPADYIDKVFLLHSWSSQPGAEVTEPAINGTRITWQSYGADSNKTTVEEL